MKCFKEDDMFVFTLMNLFAVWLEILLKKFFGGHTSAVFLVQYITPPSPSRFLSRLWYFLYSALFQFVTTLKRSFYHWDGFKNYLQKNSKNRICYCRRVNTAGGHTISLTHPHTTPHNTKSLIILFPISSFLFPFPLSSQTLISIARAALASTIISRSHDQAPEICHWISLQHWVYHSKNLL